MGPPFTDREPSLPLVIPVFTSLGYIFFFLKNKTKDKHQDVAATAAANCNWTRYFTTCRLEPISSLFISKQELHLPALFSKYFLLLGKLEVNFQLSAR